MTDSLERNEKLRLPAVTVCAFPGWANGSSVKGVYKGKCQNESSAGGFFSCIKSKTFNFNDLIVYATHAYKKLSDFKLWTWDMTVPSLGRCYTLDYDVPVGIDADTDIVVIKLNENHHYFVVLHETSLYAVTTNRLAATTYSWLDPKTYKGSTQLTLEAVKWKRLNRPEQPCNPSPDYNFTQCVIESKAKQVGCSLPWNKEIPGTYAFNQT